MKQKNNLMRWFFYLLSMLILALGLILNIEAGLGSSAIMSVAYTVSLCSGLNLGDMTFIIYCIFIAAQMVINGRNRSWVVYNHKSFESKRTIFAKTLQYPVASTFIFPKKMAPTVLVSAK